MEIWFTIPNRKYTTKAFKIWDSTSVYPLAVVTNHRIDPETVLSNLAADRGPRLHPSPQTWSCKGCAATRKGCRVGRPRPGPCPPPRGGGLHPAVHASWFLLSKGGCASAGPVGSPPRTVGVWASHRMFPQTLASASTRTPALTSRGRGMHYNGTGSCA